MRSMHASLGLGALVAAATNSIYIDAPRPGPKAPHRTSWHAAGEGQERARERLAAKKTWQAEFYANAVPSQPSRQVLRQWARQGR